MGRTGTARAGWESCKEKEGEREKVCFLSCSLALRTMVGGEHSDKEPSQVCQRPKRYLGK